MSRLSKKAFSSLHKLFSGYYNVLLICLVLLFIFRPYGRTSLYLPFWKLLLTMSLVAAVFNCNHHKNVRNICMFLAIPAVIFSWLNVVASTSPIFVINAAVTVVFLGICTCSILYDVVLRARVTLETLRGVICAYFMVAFAFAYTYYLIEYIIPETFQISTRHVVITSYAEYLSEMLYFSFVTLLTIGFGDITAVKDIGQTAVVIEGILGQFYIAILVARIVSVYSFSYNKKLLHEIEKDFSKLK